MASWKLLRNAIKKCSTHIYNNMKNKKKKFRYPGVAIGGLIYTWYYWAMRSSAGVLRLEDKIICGAIGLICLVRIIVMIIRFIREKQENN